jgi:hypothetical protein
MSQEGGRIIEIIGVSSGIYAVSIQPLKRVVIIISFSMSAVLILSTVNQEALMLASRQLRPCYAWIFVLRDAKAPPLRPTEADSSPTRRKTAPL